MEMGGADDGTGVSAGGGGHVAGVGRERTWGRVWWRGGVGMTEEGWVGRAREVLVRCGR